MYLTRKQREVLEFIGNFIHEEGYSPSLEEIGAGLGLSSLATVHQHLKNLEAKGLLERRWNHSRALELTARAEALLQPELELASPGGVAELPLLGRIAAGVPIEAVEQSETLVVPESMLGRGRTYVLQVRGDSMIDEQIRDGDFVIVEERAQAENGETVVALIRGEETTLKKFYREGNRVRLQPANPAYPPILVSPEELEIRGVVTGVVRKYQ